MKQPMTLLRTYGPLALIAVIVLGLAALPPEPAYGPYSRLDLVSFTDYRSVPVSDVIDSELELMRMIAQLGLPATMQKTSEDPEYVLDAACHGVSHLVGQAAFRLKGARALQECTTHCFSGCYHGALQGMGLEAGGDFQSLLTDVRALCGAQDTAFERQECFHGSGHGFLLTLNYERDQALDACRLLGVSEYLSDCYSGVFMENWVGDGQEQRFRRADAHYPCNTYGDPMVQETCYRFQPDWFLALADQDFARAQQQCLAAPSVAQATCFRRLGQLSGADTPDPPGNTEAFCASVPPAFYDACILGGLREVFRVNGVDLTGTAASFCRALTGERAKGLCYDAYARQLPEIFNDRATRLRLCGVFEAPYDEACRMLQ